jgi:hypothetical protein
MDIQENLNIASNSKHFPSLYGKLQVLLDYCEDYFNGRKHRIRPAIKRTIRKVGKLRSFWQYVGDFLSGNKYGYEK